MNGKDLIDPSILLCILLKFLISIVLLLIAILQNIKSFKSSFLYTVNDIHIHKMSI